MTSFETVLELIKSTPQSTEPGTLEWFRSRMPLPLLLQAFFEDPDYRWEFGFENEATADSASYDVYDMARFRGSAEAIAEHFELFDDPDAKEIAARLRRLTGFRGRFKLVR
jgi:hypothetical protein